MPFVLMILAFKCGRSRPTVVKGVSTVSVVKALKHVGEASVSPKISLSCGVSNQCY